MKKKNHKLVLKKTMIANLNRNQLLHMLGGDDPPGSDRLCTNIPCYSAGCATHWNTCVCPKTT